MGRVIGDWPESTIVLLQVPLMTSALIVIAPTNQIPTQDLPFMECDRELLAFLGCDCAPFFAKRNCDVAGGCMLRSADS